MVYRSYTKGFCTEMRTNAPESPPILVYTPPDSNSRESTPKVVDSSTSVHANPTSIGGIDFESTEDELRDEVDLKEILTYSLNKGAVDRCCDPRLLSNDQYTVGWLCTLPKSELVAAIKMLDE